MCSIANANYDLEAFEAKLDGVIMRNFPAPTADDAIKVLPFFADLLETGKADVDNCTIKKMLAKRGLSKYAKNSWLIQCLYALSDRGEISETDADRIRDMLQIKRCKSHSGILSITVFTSPYPTYTDPASGETRTQQFTCNWNCHYCPNEPGQPRSYLKGEPGVLRANRYGFDAAQQMWGRLSTLYNIGHKIRGAKLEVLVLGGTFTSYPVPYREEFMRDIYFAANTFFGDRERTRRQLAEEIATNRDADVRVIGLTVEFRPDSISRQELYRLRSYGCTRVQLGVQHIDNGILRRINRKCTTERFVKSLTLLKDVGFKVDIHLMANLPFSSPEVDRAMLIDRFLGMMRPPEVRRDVAGIDEWIEYDIAEPDLSADQWKLYPCETVPYTEIERWYREGTYVPYGKEDLYKLLYDTKRAMYPWIRCNRIIRDIPKGYIIASSDDPNTGQMLLDDLRRNGHVCMCIRCREVKGGEWSGDYTMCVRKYRASGGDEYFISAESRDAMVLYGFARLRVRSRPGAEVADDIFPELRDCALLRELHVYGIMNPVGADADTAGTSQHRGVGKRLLQVAEDLARTVGNCSGISVIAGVGVQRYYEKCGYRVHGHFMCKSLIR